jgi:hypothetical protein
MDRSRTSEAPGKLLRLREQNEALAAAAGHAATSSSASSLQQPAAENDARPAPWKLATLLLDKCVSWHASFQCPQCEHRLDLEGGRCELCPASFPYHPPIGRGRKAWACSDPRFTKVCGAHVKGAGRA